MKWVHENLQPFEPTRLECARQVRGMRLLDLAREMEVSTSTLDRWERGKTCPTRPQIERLADVLDVPLMFLFGKAMQSPGWTSMGYFEDFKANVA